jgi:aminoglycoside phosphotransferase (APT) family kinase protein
MIETLSETTPEIAAALRGEIARRDPGTTRAVLIHLDFCAENMLIDTCGHLRVIDNELLTIAPAAAALRMCEGSPRARRSLRASLL